MEYQVCKNDLDLVRSKEPSWTGILAETEFHRLERNARKLIFVRVFRLASKLVEAESIECMWISPILRDFVKNTCITLYNDARGKLKAIG